MDGEGEDARPSNHALDHRGGGPSRRTKLFPACIACRQFKIRCLPAANGTDSCSSCLKRSRPCVFPGPPKPRLRSSEKISQLEEKIEALTAALGEAQPSSPFPERHQSQSRQREGPQLTPSSTTGQDSISRSSWTSGNLLSGLPQRPPDPRPAPNLQRPPGTQQPRRVSQDLPNLQSQSTQASTITSSTRKPDVIDRGILDLPTAHVLFNHWSSNMLPLLPTVTLHSNIKELRTKFPVLFLAILTVTSPAILPSLAESLRSELDTLLIQHVFLSAQRSLELIQACLIYAQYYVAPLGSQPFASTLYVSMATALATDLGLSQMGLAKPRWNKVDVREVARTWLACWYAASSNETLLRQHCSTLSTTETMRFMDIILTGEHVTQCDKWLCSLVRLQLLMDDVTKTLHHTPAEMFDDLSTQHQVTMAAHRLREWKASTPQGVDQRISNYLVLCTDLCIHHIALRSFFCKAKEACESEDIHQLKHKDLSLTSSHLNMLFGCLEATKSILRTYLAWEDSFVRSLPNSYLLWTLYATVSLIKLIPFQDYIQSRNVTSGAGATAIFDDDPNSAFRFLDAMIKKTAQSSENKYHPQAKSANMAFLKLRSFLDQKRDICINAMGGQANEPTRPFDGSPIYNVFGHDAEGILPSPATSTRQQDKGRENEEGRLAASNPIQSPLRAPGATDLAFDPPTYATPPGWIPDDFNMNPEEFQQFDAVMMDFNFNSSFMDSLFN